MIILKSPAEIEKIRSAGRVLARILRTLGESITPGVTTTADLDALARLLAKEAGARPAFKGYMGYPAHICTSVNNQVVHGLPSGRVLMPGDIVSIDMGIELDGYYADAAITVPVGEVSTEAQRLLDITRQALYVGIDQARVGNRIGDIASAIQRFVEKHGYSVVRELVGHGVGRKIHEDPPVPNFGKPGRGTVLREGMTLAIEPMVNQGKPQVVCLPDKWTFVTEDGKLSAHFEHTVAITRKGPLILTVE
ncbi:MAG: type I methionyl aminopeptidase [Armatimonadota bacterium]|nr:type I methionyl aminopeptidase [bacterium]MCS7308900.1 type I methionyl aminopeptidase [Armatimonadota bacterium]MDW8103538.1 type I methionyl aminopeptidase [Armatimonadota bacterium]MDW8289480.1 type I methionyl aminopeptidase [Armatimonadota bacterium]